MVVFVTEDGAETDPTWPHERFVRQQNKRKLHHQQITTADQKDAVAIIWHGRSSAYYR